MHKITSHNLATLRSVVRMISAARAATGKQSPCFVDCTYVNYTHTIISLI